MLRSRLLLLFTILVSSLLTQRLQAQTLANPYIVTTFPTTISNISTAGGETAVGMQGQCNALPCCSVNVFKVTLPANGVLRVEMNGFTPLSGSIIAYYPTVANPTSYSDIAFVSSSPGNFCGFRDTLQLGRAYQGWDNTPYGQVPTTLSGLTTVYDFNSPYPSVGYFPAGDYYLLVFNENQQTSQGVGSTVDLTFEFVEACAPLTTPASVQFNTLEPNGGKDTIGFYVKNDRTEDVTIDLANTTITGGNSADFSIITNPASSLVVGDSTLVEIEFAPSASGTRTSTFEVAFSDVSCSATSNVTLQGAGSEAEIGISGNGISITNNDFTPSANNFTNMGVIITNTGSLTQTYQITNTGTDTLEFTNNPVVALSGNSQFAVTSQPSATVLPGASTSFDVTFTPTTDGTVLTDVSIASNDLDESTFMFRLEATGAERNGLHFDGSNDYVNINSVADDVVGVSAFTVESWIKAAPTQTGNDHILAANTSGSGTKFLFRLDDGILDFYDGSTAFEAGPDLRDDQWHHVAATYNNGTLKLYVDGINHGTFNAATITFATSNRWSLGQEYDGNSRSEYFKGALNDVRVWKVARTDQQIADDRYCEIQSPAIQSDLVAYYTFNQGVSNGTNTTITSVNDASSFSNHGTPTNFALTGTTSNFVSATNVGVNCNSVSVEVCDANNYTVPGGKTYSASGVYIDTLAGSTGDSIVFTDLIINYYQVAQTVLVDTTVCDTLRTNAKTEYTPFATFEKSENNWVEINGVVGDLVNTNRSIFLWMKAAGQVSGDNQILVGINSSGTATVTNMMIRSDEKLDLYDGSNYQTTNTVVTDGVWHHVGYTYDEASNKTTTYIDGIEVDSYTNGQSISATSRISLGQEFDGSTPSEFFDGHMAEVTFWNEVLDSADIALLMQSSVESSHPKYANLKAYYPMVSACGEDVLTVKDFGPHGYDGTASTAYIEQTDTLVAIPNYNAAPLYAKSWTRNGTQVASSDTLELINQIQPGTYALTLTRDNFEISDNWNVTVQAACAGLFASLVVDSNATCNGLSDGGATASATNGQAPYTYVWNNGATTASITGVGAGTYSVTVTDNTGTTDSSSVTITEPQALSANVSTAQNTVGNGSSTGVASASPTGGTAPYTYVWSNGAPTASNSGLVAGTYTATVTDANGCTTSMSTNVIEVIMGTAADIVITEINYNPAESGSDSTEYIEIYNKSTGPIDLSGFQFTSGVVYTFPSGITIQGESYLVTGVDSVAIMNRFGITNVRQWSSGGLSNGGEPIALKDAAGNAVDSLRYDDVSPWPTSPDGTGTTLVLCDPNSDNTNGANWSASSTILSGVIVNSKQVYGSPGAEDDTCSIAGVVASVVVDSNVTCNGFSNGGATASGSNGAAPYTYVWNNGATTASITGVVAGTYSVTVTDNTGTTDSSSVIIIEPTVLVAMSMADSNVTCNSYSNGGASASASGGTSPYNYVWNNGATTASITGVGAGTYSVTVSDANGCTDSSSVAITEPAALIASAVLDSNDMGNGGGATAAASGGTMPYNYFWNNGATTSSVTGLPAGTYSITVSDNSSCTDSASVTITAGPNPVIVIDSNVTCNGFANGGATVSGVGGSMPYTYVWNNGATTASITGVIAGTYTVTITDNNGLTGTNSATITEPTVLVSATVVDSNVSCNAFSNGGATTSATGGTMPYVYTWNNGATTASITGVGAGTYSVTVSDANGCADSSSVAITEPAALIASAVLDSNDMGNGGGATAAASGGTMPYNYFWNNGATTSSVTGLPAGTYSITVSDNSSCTDSASVTITAGPNPVIVIDSNVTCFGFSDGGATASATGGVAPYSYAWSNGASTNSVTNLGAGTYTVTVTDNGGLTGTNSITIVEPAQMLLDLTVVVDSIGISISNGISPYTYHWSNGTSGSSATNLPAGTYTVTVTDDNGCTVDQMATVEDTAEYFVTTWNTGFPNDFIVIPTNSNLTYNYDIDWDGDNIFDDLGVTGDAQHQYATADTHTIKIRGTFPALDLFNYFNNSLKSKLLSVDQWGAIQWETMRGTFGDANNVEILAADAPDLSMVTDMSFMFFGASSMNQDISHWDVSNVEKMNNLFTNASSFNQTIAAWDVSSVTNMSRMFNGASAFNQDISNWSVDSVENMESMFNRAESFNQNIGSWNTGNVEDMEAMFADATVFNQDISTWNTSSVTNMDEMFKDAEAFNQNIDTWDVSNVVNIEGMFQEAISFNQDLNSWDVSGVKYAGYMFRDAAAFDGQIGNWVLDSLVEAESMFKDASSFNQDISAWNTANVVYMQSMFEGATSFNQNIGGWDVGNVVYMSSIFEEATVFNQDIGNWNVSSVESFRYAFREATAFNQDIGNWAVDSVVDMNRMFEGAVNFNQDIGGWSTTSVEDISLAFSGAISFNQNLGNWDVSNVMDAWSVFNNVPLSIENYDSILIGWASQSLQNGVEMNANSALYCQGESARQSMISNFGWTISDSGRLCPPVISLVIDSNVTCFGGNNGGASAGVTEGAAPYTYLWSNGSTTNSATNLIAGKYYVTVSDQLGQQSVDSIVITEPALLVAATVLDSNTHCFGSSDGGATASATGGTGPYSYTWNNAATTASITGIAAGTYSVTITDNNGCTDSASVAITEPEELAFNFSIDSAIACNGEQGIISYNITGGTAPYFVGISNDTIAAMGIDTVSATVFPVFPIYDINGCTDTVSLMVPEPTVLVAATVIDSNESCAGAADGGLSSSATGGTAPYTYNWSSGALVSSATNLTAGTYTVTITDDNGCTTTASNAVTVVDVTAPTVITQDITVYLNGAGLVNITPADIDNGSSDNCGIQTMSLDSTSFDCGEIGANTVTLTVTDVSGNADSATATVTVMDTLNPTVLTQNITVYLDAAGQVSITTADIDNSSSDNCGIQSMSLDSTLFDCGEVGTNTVVLTVTDVNGNVDSATAVVTVLDTLNPIVVTQNATVYLDAMGQGSITTADIDNGSNDNCSTQTMSVSNDSFNCSDLGNNTIYLVVTDVNGNVDSAMAMVMVLDTIAPTLVVAADTTLCATSTSGAVHTYAISASENCSTTGIIQTAGLPSGSDFPIGVTTNVFEITDQSGNTRIDSFTVEVLDFPVLSVDAVADLCETDETVTLSAQPVGGIFSGAGVNGNMFDPTAVSAGSQEVTYTYTTAQGCVYTAQTYVQVRLNPEVFIGSFADTICLEESVVANPVGTPSGGIYSGPGIENNVLNVDSAGVGTHYITYTYTDGYGCTSSDSTLANIVQCLDAVGVNEVRESGFAYSLYPNPNQGRFMLKHNSTEVLNCSIYATNGTLVKTMVLTAMEQEIMIGDQAQGLYLIRLTGNGIHEQIQFMVY